MWYIGDSFSWLKGKVDGSDDTPVYNWCLATMLQPSGAVTWCQTKWPKPGMDNSCWSWTSLLEDHFREYHHISVSVVNNARCDNLLVSKCTGFNGQLHKESQLPNTKCVLSDSWSELYIYDCQFEKNSSETTGYNLTFQVSLGPYHHISSWTLAKPTL